MPSKTIHAIPLGMAVSYLIKGEKNLLIDAGSQGQMRRLREGLYAAGLQLVEIDYLLITHAHIDHIGLANEVIQSSKAPVIAHQEAVPRLSSGICAPLHSKNFVVDQVVSFLMNVLGGSQPIVLVDIVVDDEGLDLNEFGVPGRLTYTPGHTLDSLSLLLDTGEAFIGDLAMNSGNLRIGPGLPLFAEDYDQVKQSWERLLDLGVKTIYSGHGKPFPAEILRKQLR